MISELPYAKIIFLQGVAFDTIITPIGVLMKKGTEGNQLINWIDPPELMMTVFILSNLAYIPVMLWMTDRIETRFQIIILSGIGITRLLCGSSWVIV